MANPTPASAGPASPTASRKLFPMSHPTNSQNVTQKLDPKAPRRLQLSPVALEIVQQLYSLEQLISRSREQLQSSQYHGLMELVSQMKALTTDREDAAPPRSLRTPSPTAASMLQDNIRTQISPSRVRIQSSSAQSTPRDTYDASMASLPKSRTPDTITSRPRPASPIRVRAHRPHSSSLEPDSSHVQRYSSVQRSRPTPSSASHQRTSRSHDESSSTAMMLPPNYLMVDSFDEDELEIETLSNKSSTTLLQAERMLEVKVPAAPDPIRMLTGSWPADSSFKVPIMSLTKSSTIIITTRNRATTDKSVSRPVVVRTNGETPGAGPTRASSSKLKDLVSSNPERVPQMSNTQPVGLPRLKVVSSEPDPSQSPRATLSPRSSGNLLVSPRSAFVAPGASDASPAAASSSPAPASSQ